jgi:hypothetical protein
MKKTVASISAVALLLGALGTAGIAAADDERDRRLIQAPARPEVEAPVVLGYDTPRVPAP